MTMVSDELCENLVQYYIESAEPSMNEEQYSKETLDGMSETSTLEALSLADVALSESDFMVESIEETIDDSLFDLDDIPEMTLDTIDYSELQAMKEEFMQRRKSNSSVEFYEHPGGYFTFTDLDLDSSTSTESSD